ncbi:MAG: MarR family transcriptional regulator [Planctomycetes bacterium]|nr:MarR family transcriptional regulator [Planctomycetota bacterium]
MTTAPDNSATPTANDSASAELRRGLIAAVLARTADCLAALFRTPTEDAGLNESRYTLLDALRRMPEGTSTQAGLAQALLQSESNLSTLLERMQQDGLISRVRSTTDRRKTLIGLAPAGSDALLRADYLRDRVAARLLASLNDDRARDLYLTLLTLLQQLESELGLDQRSQTATPNLVRTHSASDGVVPAPHWPTQTSATATQVSSTTNGQQP